MHALAQLAGAVLVVVGLTDIFLTVLYARSGVGVISRWLIPLTWKVFRAAFGHLSHQPLADLMLALAGPFIIVLVVGVWVWTLIIGFGLMLYARLGVSLISTQGVDKTPNGISSALALAGDSMTTVGNAEFIAITPYSRILMLLISILGLSIITLTLAFLVEIYTAMLRRNRFALALEFASDRTGDAVKLLAAMGAGDDFSAAQPELSTLADALIDVYEAHHFYSALLYFRFREPYYALARMMLIVMDTVTLIHSALSDEKHGKLKRSAAVAQLHHGGMHLLRDLSRVFLPHGGPPPDAGHHTGRDIVQDWRKRFDAALDYLKSQGISTTGDADTAAKRYSEMRREWDSYVVAFATYMAQPMDSVDTAMDLLK